MLWVTAFFLILFLSGYADDHTQNDPYSVEETEFEYEGPGPYYEDEYPHLHHQKDKQQDTQQKEDPKKEKKEKEEKYNQEEEDA